MQFVMLPLHKEKNPSSFMQRLKQSVIPLYDFFTYLLSLSVCKINFTLSIGAFIVFEIAPASPPAKKSNRKLNYFLYLESEFCIIL